MADTSTCAVCRTPIHRTRVGWEHDIVAMGEWAVTAHHAACPSEPEVTTEHEALAVYDGRWDERAEWWRLPDGDYDPTGSSYMIIPDSVVRGIRAQVDEDVRRLVEAVAKPHELFWCGADLDNSGNNFCRRWATWSFRDWEWSGWKCYEHAHQKPDWWDDEEQGEWVTPYEEDAEAVALVAALEPFKAVAPTEEAARG